MSDEIVTLDAQTQDNISTIASIIKQQYAMLSIARVASARYHVLCSPKITAESLAANGSFASQGYTVENIAAAVTLIDKMKALYDTMTEVEKAALICFL